MVTGRPFSKCATLLFAIIGSVQIVVLVLVINCYTANKTIFNGQVEPSKLPKYSSNHRSTVVIYNRIPKTGSTTLMKLPYKLFNKHKYNVLLLNLTGGPRSYTMNLKDRMELAWNITGKKTAILWPILNFNGSTSLDKLYHIFNLLSCTAWKEKHPGIIHGHFAYMDTSSMIVNRETNVLYINMIRRPIDR